MTDSAVAVNRLETFQILLSIYAQISLNQKTISLDDPNDAIDLLVS